MKPISDVESIDVHMAWHNVYIASLSFEMFRFLVMNQQKKVGYSYDCYRSYSFWKQVLYECFHCFINILVLSLIYNAYNY